MPGAAFEADEVAWPLPSVSARQYVPAGEVVEEGSLGDAQPVSDLLDRCGFVADLAEQLESRFVNLLAKFLLTFLSPGAVTLYSLADMVGFDTVDDALKQLVELRGFQSEPYALSTDFLDLLFEHTSPGYHRVIEDFTEVFMWIFLAGRLLY